MTIRSVAALGLVIAAVMACTRGDQLKLKNTGSSQATAFRPPPPRQEVYVLFIGMTGCGASQREELVRAVRAIRDSLTSHIDTTEFTFAVAGAALDHDPTAGLKWLGEFGKFDEVLAGRSWMNLAAVEFIWRDLPARPLVPQLVVVVRSVAEPDDRNIDVGTDRLLARKMGVAEIVDWVNAGTPLPLRREPVSDSTPPAVLRPS